MGSVKKTILLLVALLGVFVSSCGDNITETDVYKRPSVFQYGQDARPACDSSTRGLVTFEKDSLFFCDGTEWSSFDGKEGMDGAYCKSVLKADGFDIYCDDTLAGTVKNGIGGPVGEPGDKGGQGTFGCEVSETSDGYDVLCDGTKIGSIANGKKGPEGFRGKSGTYCVTVETAQGYDVLCDGEKVGEVSNGKIGPDGFAGDVAEGCTLTSGDDGRFVLQCGEESVEMYSALCGTVPYDPAGEKFCSGVNLFDKCGTSTYDPSTKACCGTALYTSSTQFCSNNKVYNKCGTSTYDPSTKACCGTTLYTSSTQFCSSSKVYNKCGTSTYDPSTQFCDTRDKQLYKYVKVGSQTWMAQNLRYAASGSSCAKSDCATYGRLYTTAQAKTACMSGWRLPSDSDWNTLFSGKTKAQLKAKTGWSKVGTDDYKMSILPIVNACKYGYTMYQEKTAIFWTSNAHNANLNRVARICDAKAVMETCSYTDTGASNSAELKNGFSVRCIKK